MKKASGNKVIYSVTILVLLVGTLVSKLSPATVVIAGAAIIPNEVGVYWDSECSVVVSSIDWGTLEPGSVMNTVIYIRNEVEEPQFLSMSTINWNPSKASEYITLIWNYSGRLIYPGEILQIKLVLSISRYIEGISNFSFDILIAGIQNCPGDINGDGHVNLLDLSLLARHWHNIPTYDPRADINMDGSVDLLDLGILAQNWLKGPLD